MAFGNTGKRRKSVRLKNFMSNAVRGVKSFVVNKAMSGINASSLISNYGSTFSEVKSGNVSGINKLLKKSPFEKTLNTTGSNNAYDDPLGFSHLQYPTELTGTELGNWILFFSISTNLGNNPAYNSDLELSESMGMNPGKRWVDESTTTSNTKDNAKNKIREAGADYDSLRAEYKKKGIVVPRMQKHNTVLTDDATLDVVSGAIALYMPNDVKVSYGADWGVEDTGVSGDIGAAYRDIKRIKKDETPFGDIVKTFIGHALGVTSIKAAQVASNFTGIFGTGDWLKLAGKAWGLAMNNRKEVFYEGPGFRTFDYNFAFWPRNNSETEEVQKIITMFKYHMHPWKDEEWGGRVFRYPSEFEIHYMHRTGVNDKLNKIARCALTKCDVNYTPSGGNFKTFEDNAPVTYSINLQFK